MHVVVSAFEPFAGREENRSMRVLARIERLRSIRAAVLPVRFAALPRAIEVIARTRPDL